MSSYFSKCKSFLSSIPAFFIALIPVFKSCPPCPLCMPKYAAVLSLLGLELSDYTAYLLPVMALSMLFTLFTIFHQSFSKKSNLKPFYLNLMSFFGIITFKYILDLSFVVYFFMFTLLVSILWHQYNMRKINHCCSKH